jgi:DNA-directed RNA polymerase subunit omega
MTQASGARKTHWWALTRKVPKHYHKSMIFPLEELIKYQDNMYEITSASARRSYQLSRLDGPEVEENDGKVVSLAARQVFTGKVKFRPLENMENTAIPVN